MKKTRKKGIRSLAILLVLILTLGFSPVTNVEAKAAPRLNYKKVTLVQGKKKRLKVRNLSRRRKVKWYSTKKSVATVNKKGIVKAKKKGKAYIVAKVGKKRYRCKVIVKKKISKKKKKSNKKVKINKSTKKQLPSYKLAFMPEKNYAAGTSLDFFTTIIDHWAKDFSNTSDSVRTKCWRWYSSNKSVISFNSRGIATFKKAGRANVYCKYLTKSGTWIKSSVETIKVFEGGSVKFSYTLGLEDSPFGGTVDYVWDFQHEDPVKPNPAEPKFNVIILNVKNNSSKSIKLDSDIGINTSTSQPKIVHFSTVDKKDVWIPANSEQSVKFYTYYANGSFGKVYNNYIVDKKVLVSVGVGYSIGTTNNIVVRNYYGTSNWQYIR